MIEVDVLKVYLVLAVMVVLVSNKHVVRYI
jgi:hypothetical protein